MKADMKNIHFLVPRPLYEEFKTAFPEVGLMKILFTRFMQLAIDGARKKDCFVESVYRECVERAEEDGEEEERYSHCTPPWRGETAG